MVPRTVGVWSGGLAGELGLRLGLWLYIFVLKQLHDPNRTQH